MCEIKFRQYVWDDSSKQSGQMVGWDALLAEECEGLSAVFNTTFSNASPLMQYTGLKDKNGIEIYEGDILQVQDLYELPENTSMTYNNQVVTFENCSFCLGGEVMSHDYDYISEECEVIGNIYANPELA
ncbi:YopX family protein [Bacillus thuringiensis]|nr:YopX family protein [Bacillus thuringiensis]